MIIIVMLTFLFITFLSYGIMITLFENKILISNRLYQLRGNNKNLKRNYDEELQKSFFERLVKPILEWLSNITQKIIPIRRKDILEKKLLLAGNPGDLTPSELMTLYYTFTIIFAMCVFLVVYLNNISTIYQILSLLWGLIISRILFDLAIKIKTTNRQDAISKELPDVLDLLTVSVESGLGFDAAIQKVVKKTKGPISYEFNKTLQEMKMGKHRREALRGLAYRTGVEDLNTFISAIIQADQLGVSIGNVLRIQSKQMRQIRKQRIEEKAMKAPIKMLIPMVFFIFPTLFLVLLGPAVIQLLETMW
ncbi:type II secretion system F family protein [Serpentinicella sp. ANB-PHB4]|uniref:type II secretion system F family protein n=1 Tax=Serpentinicella sp. ANB-PHB4 TaxID=3074076 RepID=UPI00285A1F00|nr:type II secretion system F family protein [Serpentinicella sp. ANB-PHB4]MDR5658926.1 type II secretion system F family protein [Serpentinicella sp. ANB-PHB4]